MFQCAHPALVARTARLNTLADPHFFLGQFLVEQGGVLRLDFQRGALLLHIIIVVAGPCAELSAVQFHDARRQAAHEGTIMTDEQQRTVVVDHHVLEPGDGLDVQMIGRLVEQQEVGFGDQRAPKHHAPAPTAGQGAHERVALQLQPRYHLIDLQLGLPIAVMPGGVDAAHDHVENGLIAGGRHLLSETRHFGSRSHPDLAAIRDDGAGNQPQQRGLAFPVPTKQADTLTLADLQGDIVQQRLEPETQGHFIEAYDGHEAAYSTGPRGVTHVQIPAQRETSPPGPAAPALRREP